MEKEILHQFMFVAIYQLCRERNLVMEITIFNPISLFSTLVLIVFMKIREKRFKEEIEQYRQERPKIQQQFSDLKVSNKFIILVFIINFRLFIYYLFIATSQPRKDARLWRSSLIKPCAKIPKQNESRIKTTYISVR